MVTAAQIADESDSMTKPTKPTSGVPKTAPKKTPAKTAATKSGAAKGAPAKSVQSRKIVNQRQTPWGLILITVLVVALAAGVIGYAVTKTNSKKSSTSAVAADAIVGIQHYPGLTRNHVAGTVAYKQSPPVGGDHSPVWADCTGTIYPDQIASENAVHDLEHGAVWVTYKPGLAAAQLDVLTKLVAGQQYLLLTPYAGLKTNISLQAWGYQLFVDSATDPRIDQFIKALRLSTTNTPEYGASCDNASFKTKPSVPGKPTES
ncbi:DUF3105 domain-containing protein [soil metagenome]